MQITFGDRILEVNLERSDLDDLQHSKANALSSEIFASIKEDILTEMRACVRTGDNMKAQHLEGYMTCLEDLMDMYATHIPEALLSK